MRRRGPNTCSQGAVTQAAAARSPSGAVIASTLKLERQERRTNANRLLARAPERPSAAAARGRRNGALLRREEPNWTPARPDPLGSTGPVQTRESDQ